MGDDEEEDYMMALAVEAQAPDEPEAVTTSKRLPALSADDSPGSALAAMLSPMPDVHARVSPRSSVRPRGAAPADSDPIAEASQLTPEQGDRGRRGSSLFRSGASRVAQDKEDQPDEHDPILSELLRSQFVP